MLSNPTTILEMFHISERVVAALRLEPLRRRFLVAEVAKKHKKMVIKPFMVKNHMRIFVNAKINNPTFDSQVRPTPQSALPVPMPMLLWAPCAAHASMREGC